jgi:hypothetical protein
MRRGFNKYSQNEDDESRSENPSEQGRSLTNLSFLPFANLPTSTPTLSASSSLGEGIMLTLFQVVEQQSMALQALMTKVDSITQKSLELADRIRELKCPFVYSERPDRRSDLTTDRTRGAALLRAKP